MSSHLRQTLSVSLLVVACLAGCSEEVAEPTAVETETPKAKPAEVSKVSRTPKREQKKAEPESKIVDKAALAAKIAAEKFDPPFPNRVELFDPPGKPKPAARRAGTGDEQVELKGFVVVNGQQRAMFAFDGRPAVLGAGESHGDVKVVLIDGPTVTLQRGRIRWTESLAQDDER